MDILIVIIAVCLALLFGIGLIAIGKKGIEDFSYFWSMGDYGWCFSIVVIVVLVYSIAAVVTLALYSKIVGVT